MDRSETARARSAHRSGVRGHEQCLVRDERQPRVVQARNKGRTVRHQRGCSIGQWLGGNGWQHVERGSGSQ